MLIASTHQSPVRNLSRQMGLSVTCANEHDIILSILCFYFVHHYLGKLIVDVCFDYDRSIVNWVDRVEHGWVASGKGNNFIWELLRSIKSSKCLAWTLVGEKYNL